MQNNYKRLGDYIREVDVRNVGLKISNLLGLTINKNFIPSVANIIGTDLEKYKIIRKNQFACSTMQVRRDGKMPVALLKDFEEAIISQAYPIFEVINQNILLPEYLMMWFSRSEFDREACFHAVGGVRGSLEWEDFLNFQLPVPSIKKQREIVKEYNAVQNRINLNNQLIKKLEETAQAIYKEWFVDFEFPDENGMPYKSNGGKMVWNDKLEKEIPEGWRVGALGDVSNCLDYKRRPLSQEEREKMKNGELFPYYGAASKMDEINSYLFDGDYLLFAEDGSVQTSEGFPILQYVSGKFWVNNHAHILEGKDFISINYLFLTLKRTNISELITGAVQPKINQQNMNSINILIARENIHKKFDLTVMGIFNLQKIYRKQNQKLNELKTLLLSKLATVEG